MKHAPDLLSALLRLVRNDNAAPSASAAALAALAAAGENSSLLPTLASNPSVVPTLVGVISRPHPRRAAGQSAADLLAALQRQPQCRGQLAAYEGRLVDVAADFREHNAAAVRARRGCAVLCCAVCCAWA